MKPAEVAKCAEFARHVFPGNRGGTAENWRAWEARLLEYTLDDTYTALSDLAAVKPDGDYEPSLSVGRLLGELDKVRRRHGHPVAAPVNYAKGEPAVHPSANPYRQKLREDLLKFHRRTDGTVDPAKLAEIDEEVSQVGPREAAFLATQGIDVQMTMRAEDAIAEPSPKSTAELAADWLDRWTAADDAERMEMRSEQLTDELKDAVRSLRASRKASK